MGNKINPIALRLGINKEWESVWYARANYPAMIAADKSVRDFVNKEFARAGIARVNIRRKTGNIEITIKAARPGIIIGKGGTEAERLKGLLKDILRSKDVQLLVVEEKHVDMSSPILADAVARQLEKRIAFRRAMKQVVNRALKAGAQGIKVMCAGRLGGAEIARTEWYREGKVPLHTIRADIDYAFTEANTIYGKIGVKVWIYKGDIIPQKTRKEEAA